MISMRHLFELGMQAYYQMGNYVKTKRQEVDQQRQAGNKTGAIEAASRLQRALKVRSELANRGN